MPSTPEELFAAAGLAVSGAVRWGERVAEPSPGVYAVGLCRETDSLAGALPTAPLDDGAVEELLRVRPEVRVDGSPASAEQLMARIGSFWLADEVVLYVGLAGQPLSIRVRQYYRTPIGARRPHAGGWWLKTLLVIDDLWVHYAPTPDYAEAERAMLRRFADSVTDQSRGRLPDRDRVMPFANLRGWDGAIKGHGITGATAAPAGTSDGGSAGGADKAAVGDRRNATRAVPAGLGESPALRSESAGSAATQRVTAKDVQAGRVRLPRAAKRLLPDERCDLSVAVRGRVLRARWDPRMGPPERSGVLGFGRGSLDGVVRAEETLTLVRVAGRLELR